MTDSTPLVMDETAEVARIQLIYREFGELFRLLLEESNRCHALVLLSDSQFARRAFVRAAFAYIEGVTYGLKQLALLSPEGTFISGELTILREETFELDTTGFVKTRAARLATLPNLRFALLAFARANSVTYQIPVHDHRWAQLKRALDVRHRLMHPKSVDLMTVSDDEVSAVYDAGDWFTECVKSIFAQASGSSIEK